MLITTLGYEGLDTETFFQILANHHVQTLVDIRELPLSRKRGFSKSALGENANAFGLKYVHIPELGAPRTARHEYRDSDDWAKFSRIYKKHLSLQTESLDKLSAMMKSDICCLVCFEADHFYCHRHYVADALLEKFNGKLKIIHLAASKTTAASWLRPLAGTASPR